MSLPMNSIDTLPPIDASLARVCEKVRQDALEPAKAEAAKIELEARRQADVIRHTAQKEAEELLRQAQGKIEKERQLFESSLQHAGQQVVEKIKDKLEKELFLPHIAQWAETSLKDAKSSCDLATALVESIRQSGLKGDIEVILPENLKSAPLIAMFIETLKTKGAKLTFGPQTGGVQVRCEKQNLLLDFTNKVILELLMCYLRKDFRKYLFQESQ